MKKLRGPKGCPWDREQTHASIRMYLLEEAYEALETIQRKRWDGLKEELGDLLFQIIFHSEMAGEAGRFDVGDVIQGLVEKLKSRHPHVFGNARVKSAEEQTLRWDELKAKEKPGSLLDRVPGVMPALLQSIALQERAHRLGFKWKKISGVKKKLREELREWEHAQKSGDRENLEEELGDVLFMLVNLARWMKLNPEEALLKTNRKFKERFAYVEAAAKRQSKEIADFKPAELEKLWREAKTAKRR